MHGQEKSQLAAEFRRGWPVVAAGAIGTAVGTLGVTYALTILMGPLTAEFGWRRGEAAIALTFYTTATFLVTPLYGRLYDKLGARTVGTASVLVFAAAQLAATQIGESIFGLYIAYTALGLLGAGTGYLAYSRAVAARFDQGRGMAMALTMIGPSLAAIFIPLLLPLVVAAYGWRAGYFSLAAVALVALPLMLFMVGGKPVLSKPGDIGSVEATGLTIGQAVRTAVFWRLAGGVFFSALGVVGLQLHFVSMTTDLGASAVDAAATLSLLGLGVLAGRILTGVLMDRLYAPLVVGAFILTPAIGICLFQLQGVAAAPILAFCLGVALGAESDALGFLASRYFGLKSYTEIFGWLYSFFALGGAGAPLLAAAVYQWGGYETLRAVGAGLCVLGAVLYATAGPYRHYTNRS